MVQHLVQKKVWPAKLILMDFIELNGLTLDRDVQTTSIPVPKSLMDAIAANPRQFGLADGISKRQALAQLVIKGALVGAYREQEAALEASYRQMHADPEWRSAADEARAEALEDGVY